MVRVWSVKVVAKYSGGYQYPRVDVPAEVANKAGIRPGGVVELTVGGNVVILKPRGKTGNAFDALKALLELLGYKVSRSQETIVGCNDKECLITVCVPRERLEESIVWQVS